MKARCIIALILFVPPCALAGPEEIFSAANEAYGKKEYHKAVQLYDSIIGQGYVSPEIYFNLGNAYFRSDEVTRAILNYERALLLAPSDGDIKYNLKIASLRAVDKIEAIPETPFATWRRKSLEMFDSSSWAMMTLLFLWTSAALLTGLLFQLTPGVKRALLIGSLTAFSCSAASAIAASSRFQLERDSGFGIVTAESAYVKSAPDKSGADLFIVHEGLKVQLVDVMSVWVKIRLVDGKQGWMAKGEVTKI